jgi:hypothetical protein
MFRGKMLRFNKLAPPRSQGFELARREDIPLDFSIILVPPMNEVTRVLSVIEGGDAQAAEQLLPIVPASGLCAGVMTVIGSQTPCPVLSSVRAAAPIPGNVSSGKAVRDRRDIALEGRLAC